MVAVCFETQRISVHAVCGKNEEYIMLALAVYTVHRFLAMFD
jgi:hypothetical protein